MTVRIAKPDRPRAGGEHRLVELAATIAAGYCANPETSGQDPRRIARDSVTLARAIIAEVDREEGE